MITAFIRKITAQTSRSRQTGLVAAVYLQADGSALLLQLDANTAQVRQLTSHDALAAGDVLEPMLQLLSSLPPRTPICLVLAAEYYQLVQLDKPSVAESEMLLALPWLVRELTDIPPEDLLLDYIDLPAQPNQQQAKIQLVLTSRSRWLPLCQALQRRQFHVVNIQPEEWLPRNLLPKQAAAVMVLTHLPGQELSLQIIQQGAVFFSRKLRGFQRFDQYEFTELQQGLLDNLLLEVQRSLDYFEGQLRQAPVKEILFILASPTLPAIVEYFAKNGFGQVQALPFGRWLKPPVGRDAPTMAELTSSWPVLAGALELLQEEGLDEAQS